MGTTFEDLPSELFIHVIGSLQFRDILRCQAISKRFDDLIRSSVRLQYIIELGVAGCVDNPTDPSFLEERLRLLKEHQSSWKRPVLTCNQTISVPRRDRYTEFRQGVLVQFDGDLQHDSLVGYNVLDLTSTTEVSWTIRTEFSFSTVFALNSAEDLIVLNRISPIQRQHYIDISILSFRYGVTHPRASVTPISVGFDIWDTPLCTNIQIAGNLVALAVYSHRFAHRKELVILDWTTGIVKMRIMQYGDRIFQDFYLVSEQWLLVVFVTIYPGGVSGVDVFSLECITMIEVDESNSTATPTLIATYRLPSVPQEHVSRIRISSDSSWAYHKSPNRRGNPGCPFGTTKLQSLVLLTLRVVEGARSPDDTVERPGHSFDIFIPLATFLRGLSAPNETLKDPKIFNWTVWGPSSTRWSKHALSSSNMIYGYRVLNSGRIRDFNSIDIARETQWTKSEEIQARAASDGQTSATHTRIITGPTVIEAGNVFTEDVVSNLPYRETIFQSPRPLDGVWVADKLIGFNTGLGEGLDHMQLHILEGVKFASLCAIV